MVANTALVVAGLDFPTIRSNLQSFVAAKPDFSDHNFNASAISTLLDLMAYNFQQYAFYLNMGVNEAFLDSAVIRDSVVSRAKMLGYRPRSAQGATANVLINFTTAVANSTLTTLSIVKNTQFTATINGTSYRFVTPQSYLVQANSTNGFQSYINIIEGRPITHRFAYSASNTSFDLSNKKVDTRSVQVSVNESGDVQNYILANDLRTINSSSKIFFLEASKNSQYKVIFGDGVLGREPISGSTISITYRVCNGARTNGANSFTAVSTVAGESDLTITPQGRAAGGIEEESISSIKFNAPRSYSTQNRAIVVNDYKQIILRDNPDVADVAVWGGEENSPPIYGKVFVSPKPVTGVILSSSRKQQIKNGLKQYSVVSIDTEITDPSYLYIVPTITLRYDSKATASSASSIATLVANRVIAYEASQLSVFGGKFRYSRFLDYLDDSEKSIVGSSADIDVQLRVVPSLTTRNTYTLNFSRQMQIHHNSIDAIGITSSSSFTYGGFTSYFDDHQGVMRIYYRTNKNGVSTRTYTSPSAGTINNTTGQVILTDFLPTAYSGNFIKVIARPLDPNIEPVRNQILLFSDVKITVIDDDSEAVAARIDSVATVGQSAFFENQLSSILPLTY